MLIASACTPSALERSKIPELPTEQALNRFSEVAIETLSDAISSNPAVPDNYYKRAILFIKNETFDKALEDIDNADRLQPNTGKFLHLKALILRDLGKHKEALSIAQKAEILGFNTPDSYTLLGYLYQQNGNFATADNYLARSLQASPYNGDAFYYKALSSARQGDTTSALLFLDQSLAFKPRNLGTYQTLSSIHVGLRQMDQALHYNAQGLALFKNNLDLLVNRGLLMQRIGRADSAIIYYNRVNKIKPEYFQSYLYLANIYFRWRSYEKSIQYYNLVKKYKPEYKQINYSLGLCYERLDQLSMAEGYYMTAIQQNPNDVAAKYALERVSGRINFAVGYDPAAGRNKTRRDSVYYIEPQRKLLDTTRIRVNTIQPKAKVNIKTDSLRRIKIN